MLCNHGCRRVITTTNSHRTATTPALPRKTVESVQVKIKDIAGAQLTYEGQTYGRGEKLTLPSNLVAALDVVELV